MYKLISIVGARPQFVKAAMLSKCIKLDPNFKEIMIHTGQHYDAQMSDIFFEQLNIPVPHYKLGINQLSHAKMTAFMLIKLEEIFLKEKPDAVIVYGDTNSTLAAALAASKINIPIIHVEAGLRSRNKNMPEEINRLLTDHLSSLLLCPTLHAIKNLECEGITKGVYHVGDIMYDATLCALEHIKKQSNLSKRFSFFYDKFSLLTIHRDASTLSFLDLKKFLDYVDQFSFSNKFITIFPIHPRTLKLLNGEHIEYQHIKIIEPVGYYEMQVLLSRAIYVFTDSGGLQKEAYFHQVPCITLRDETEWVETIESGWNRLWTQSSWNIPKKDIIDYGDGHTALRIMNIIKTNLLGPRDYADTSSVC